MSELPHDKALRILLVDDDDEVREILSDMLSIGDHEVVPVGDPFEALKLLDESAFDLVVTDLGMPGMSGLQLAEKVRTSRPKLPVALVTGWGSQLDEADATAHGVTAILGKPFKLKEIQALVQRLTQPTDSANH